MAKSGKTNGVVATPLVGVNTSCPADKAAMERWPNVVACLFPVWKEGKCVRQSGDLKIRLVGGYYLVTLHCPTEGVETTLTAETLVDVLEQLEALVRDGKCVWAPDWNSAKKARQAVL